MHWPLQEMPEWAPVTSDDEGLYAGFFATSIDTFSYENSWAFISQETRVSGIRYNGEGLLLTAVCRHQGSPFLFIFPPLGSSYVFADKICSIAADLASASGKRVVLRKLSRQTFDVVVNTGQFVYLPPRVFLDSRDIPEDINPQVIVDIKATLACETAHFAKIRNHLRYFSTHYTPRTENLSPGKVEQVATLINEWNSEYQDRKGQRSAPMRIDVAAYNVFANVFAAKIDQERYFGKIIYVGDKAVGFTFAGRTSPQTAALYSNISLTSYRGSSEHLTMQLLVELRSRGVEWLNMGGSETKGLFDFKTKFGVKQLRHSFDAEFRGKEAANRQI